MLKHVEASGFLVLSIESDANARRSMLKRVETRCFFIYKIDYAEETMLFTVRFELPPDIEQRFRKEAPDISKEVQEVFLLELFRRGKISHYELSCALELDWIETRWLPQETRSIRRLPVSQ